MVDRRIRGRAIGQGLERLQFIAACNPYRRWYTLNVTLPAPPPPPPTQWKIHWGFHFQALRQVVYFYQECFYLHHEVTKFDLFILRCVLVNFYFLKNENFHFPLTGFVLWELKRLSSVFTAFLISASNKRSFTFQSSSVRNVVPIFKGHSLILPLVQL